MIKATLFLALLSLVFLSVFAADLPTEERGYYRKCPCKCFTGKRIKRAIKQCHKKWYAKCEVLECVPKHSHKYSYGYKGKWCCDKPHVPSTKPTTTATATPTPTPSKAPIKKCPCYCTKKRAAKADCRYKPWCEVVKCDDKHGDKKHYGYGYKPKFKCCDKKPYYPPKH